MDSVKRRIRYKLSNKRDDFIAWKKNGKKRYVIDNRFGIIDEDYLSVACIIKNEGRYIREFIEFHKLAGVDRFFIFDNGSTDNTKDVLKKYIESGEIVYIYFPGEKMQFPAYRYAIKLCKRTTRWLAFLDADEFLFSPHSSLKESLKEFEDEVAVGVNWVCFGPSGHEKRPSGLVIKNYTETFEDKDNFFNRHIKSVVHPWLVESINSPHFCRYKCGRLAVDENHIFIDGSATNTPYKSYAFTDKNNTNKLRINHYITKSVEDLVEKSRRGYPDGMPSNKTQESLERFNVPLRNDKTIERFIKELEQRLSDNQGL